MCPVLPARMCRNQWPQGAKKPRRQACSTGRKASDPGLGDAGCRRLLEEAGFVYALDKPTGEAFEIENTRTVINTYRPLGGAAFSRMLGLMAGTWHGTPNSPKASIFSSMTLFVKTYETELNDHTFIKRLSAVDPDEIIRRGKVDFSANKAALRYARVIWDKHNGQQCGDWKLPCSFKERAGKGSLAITLLVVL